MLNDIRLPQESALKFSGQRVLNGVLLLAIIVTMGIHLFTLTKYPSIFIDEAWISNASWTWLKTGVNFDSIHTGALDQFGYEWVSRFFVGEAPYLVSFSLFGLGLFQARLVAWTFGVVLIFATIQVSRRTYGLTTGLLASLFLVLSLPFLQASRWRQDVMLTAFAMLALWLALVALQDDRLWAHFLAGFLLGVGMDVHQSAILFIPALAVLYLAYYGKNVFVKRGTWVVAVGGALGIAIFLAIHVLPSSETYSKLMSFNFVSGAEAEFPVAHPLTLPASLLGEFKRYGFGRNLPEFGLIIAGVLWLLLRHRKRDIFVLLFTGTIFADFVLLSGNKTNLYAIHLYPLFLLIVAEFFISVLWRIKLQRAIQVVMALLLIGYVVNSASQVHEKITSIPEYDYNAVTVKLRETILPGSRVMAMPVWWFSLPDYDFRSSLLPTYYGYFNNYDLVESLETIRPDYIVVDEFQRQLLVDSETDVLPPGMDIYKVLRQPFKDFLAEHGQMILNYPDPFFGLITVYAITN
ncbi:MAG: glycosyltransferase family 39 protein [Anaerolineaceae bacterium]|nr:glycosyltransferase family 39 protein [Anaerolineaceae bacterium]